MNDKMLFVIGGIAIGIIITVTFSSTEWPTLVMWGDNAGTLRLNRTAELRSNINNIDAHFIERMIPHHNGAIAMAKLALAKSNHSEIKILAGAIIEAQNKEIEDMQSWYKNWFSKIVPEVNVSMMGGGMMSQNGMHMGSQEDMKTLENATDFDKAFIEAMVPHHQLAVMMAQMLGAGTDRQEMLVLANNIIESQSKEIKEMQVWYEKWYR